MYVYRRIFTSIIACGLLLGSVFFIRLQLSDRNRRPAPDFIPNVARFRTSRVCSTRTLILVNSSPTAAGRRQIVRETWAHPTITQSLDVSVAFGVGASDNVDVQRSLDWEAEIYGDIFQDASIDSGTKSATKVMDLLKIARSACIPLPDFVLKTEDDVFLNPLSLGALLENVETYSSSNIMWCIGWNRKLDRLGSNSTWVVVNKLSNDNEHPRYCTGTVYLMTGRSLDAILRRHAAQAGKTMLPEDVYVTGTLTKEAGVVLSLLGERFPFDGRIAEVDVERVAFAYLGDKMEEDAKKLWSALISEKLNDSRRSDVGL